MRTIFCLLALVALACGQCGDPSENTACPAGTLTHKTNKTRKFKLTVEIITTECLPAARWKRGVGSGDLKIFKKIMFCLNQLKGCVPCPDAYCCADNCADCFCCGDVNIKSVQILCQHSTLLPFYIVIFIQCVKVEPLSSTNPPQPTLLENAVLSNQTPAQFRLLALVTATRSLLHSSLSSSPSSLSWSSSSSRTAPCVILVAALSPTSSAAQDHSTVLPHKKTALLLKQIWFDRKL